MMTNTAYQNRGKGRMVYHTECRVLLTFILFSCALTWRIQDARRYDLSRSFMMNSLNKLTLKPIKTIDGIINA
jgi:hypothetical protein